nr:InlB B-repeat-containing protein [Clostridia bacterium]
MKRNLRRIFGVVMTIVLATTIIVPFTPTASAANSSVSFTTSDHSTFRTGGTMRINNVTSGTSHSWNENSHSVSQVQISSPVYLKTYQYQSGEGTYGWYCSKATLEVDRSRYSDVLSTGVQIQLNTTIHTREGGVRWGIELYPQSNGYTLGSLGNSWNSTTVTGSTGARYTYTLCNSSGTTMASAETSGGDFTRDAGCGKSQDLSFGPYYWYLKGSAPAVGETAVVRVVAIVCVHQGDNNYQMISDWTDLTIKGTCSHSQGYNYSCNGNGTHVKTCKTCSQQWTENCSGLSTTNGTCSVCSGSSAYTATLNGNGATAAGTASVSAVYGQNMPSATMPSRTGYTFAGYYDTSAATGGTQYYTAAGASARTWNKTAATTLYARWTANNYNVTLNGNGATTAGTASVNAAYDAAMPSATMPSRTGYTFAGYYDTSAATGGTQYYTAAGASARTWNKTAASTLYARWTANNYNVTLNGNGATTAGTASVNATYDSAMPSATMPSRTGYTFAGYYDTSAATGGTQYYTGAGASARTWNKTAASTLYARWTANTNTAYKVEH